MKTLIKKIALLCIVGMFSATAFSQTATLDDVEGIPGQQVLVPLNFTGLTNVGAVSLFITYDETVVTFDGITNLIPEAAGTLANAMTSPTQVGVSWLAPGSVGVDFPDGKFLDLQFTYINGSCDFNFTAACEVTDFDAIPFSMSYTNGSISPAPVGPTTATWTGAVSQDWELSGNWDTDVPAYNTDVTINDVTNYPVISASKANVYVGNLSMAPLSALTVNGTLNVLNNVTLWDDASLIENGTVSVGGTTMVYRSISAQWHLVSAPLDNAVGATFNGHYLRSWDDATNTWLNLTNPAMSIVPGEGYSLEQFSGPGQLLFSQGNFNYGDIPVSGLTHITTATPAYDGYNLLGNPYPSAIVWDPFGLLGIGGWNPTGMNVNAWVWDGNAGNYLFGDFAGTGTLSGNIIPPMNGFFVQVQIPGTPGSLTIPQQARTHGFTPFYKADAANVLYLTVEGNGYMDKATINFFEDASAGYDQYDAKKFEGLADAPQFYSVLEDGTMLSGNVLDATDKVAMSLTVGTADDYIITVENTEGFDVLYLYDNLTGTLVNLKEIQEYAFYANPDDVAERFTVYFMNPAGVEDNELENIHVYSNDRVIFVNPADLDANISVYNVMGQVVAIAESNSLTEISVDNAGCYIVKVDAESGSYTTKVIVR